MEDVTEMKKALETGLAERSMLSMKCPSLVVSSLQQPFPFHDDPYRPFAKVIFSFDPLATDDEETKIVMELAQAESVNIPKRYALDMSNDFTPMSVFSETSEGKVLAKGKIKNIFDMRPHNETMESYEKLCREREKKKETNQTSEMKSTRRDRGKMEKLMFNLFEKQSNWTLRQLIQETDQPDRAIFERLVERSLFL